MLSIKGISETEIVAWKARNGVDILRVSLGLIFVWFGVLKFFPGVSPAEAIAGRTIFVLTFGLVKPAVSMPLLATLECAIGIGLISRKWLRATLILLYLQMLGTFLPLVFFPHETFGHSIFIPTLLGQYILKNLVLMAAGVVIGATVRGGQLIHQPLDDIRVNTPANKVEKRIKRRLRKVHPIAA